MKKIIAMMLLGVLILSLVACSKTEPTILEIETAIENGTLTVEDALKKGYVTEEWVENYEKEMLENSVPASDKTTSNMIGDFETTTISGDVFTKGNLSTVTYIAFMNPKTQASKDAYAVLAENYEAVKNGGANILIVTLSENENELFAESEIPVIYYNDSMKNALGTLTEMVNLDGFSGSWNGNGAFLSAWNIKLDSDSLMGAMSGIMDMVNGSKDADKDVVTAIPMG